jgi:hypothetical protein
VLHALYEFLRGFQTAHGASKGEPLRETLARHPDEVYRALLTVILRLDEDALRTLASTPVLEWSRHLRKKIEMLFAHLKRILRVGRLRLRGPGGARDEFLLAANAQNLRKLAKLRSMPMVFA